MERQEQQAVIERLIGAYALDLETQGPCTSVAVQHREDEPDPSEWDASRPWRLYDDYADAYAADLAEANRILYDWINDQRCHLCGNLLASTRCRC